VIAGRPEQIDATRALVEELIRASFTFQDVLSALLEELPEEVFPGESTGEVLIEMVVGSCLPAVEGAGLETCRATTALVAALRDRVLDDLRAAADAARERGEG
jgi:hypothetical protein